jgi:prepilin-type N-terminal cleavage/methylation domain-containing protein
MARRGFSLIELIAVLSIITIVAVVSIPALSRIPRIRQAAAAAELVSDLSYARELAMTTGGRVWVEFDQVAGTYTVLTETTARAGRLTASAITDPATGRSFIAVPGDSVLGAAALTSMSVPGGGSTIRFDWQGLPYNAGDTLITSDTTIVIGSWGITVAPSGVARLTALAPI